MRKLSLIVFLALTSIVVSFGQSPNSLARNKSLDKEELSKQMASKSPFAKNEKRKGVTLSDVRNLDAKSSKRMQRKFAKAPDVVTNTPEGTVKSYMRGGLQMGNTQYGLVISVQDGIPMEIVYGDDGETVWLKDPVSAYLGGAYVQGKLSDGGKTLTVDLDQYLYYDSGSGYGLRLAWVELQTVNDGVGYAVHSDVTAATFSIDGDKITLNNTTGDDNANGVIGLGVIDLSGEWIGSIDWLSVYTAFNETYVTLPDGTETVSNGFTYEDGGGNKYGQFVDVAQVGDKFYLKGLYEGVPGVIVGDVSGNTITIHSGQFLGEYYGRYVFAMGGKVDETGELVLTEKLVFNYDEENEKYTADGVLLINAGTDRVFYLAAYGWPGFGPFVERAATPAKPSVIYYEDFYAQAKFTLLNFNIPVIDTNGNVLDPDKLYYKVYLNNTVLVVRPEDYRNVEEDMTEIPYNYDDNYDIYAKGSIFCVNNVTGFKKVGVQSIYYGSGVRNESEIGWLIIDESADAEIVEGDGHWSPDPDTSGTEQKLGHYMGDASSTFRTSSIQGERCHVATKLGGPELKGYAVKGMMIPVDNGKVENLEAWLSYNLIDNAAPDVVSVNVSEVTDGWITVNFEKPFVLGEKPIYAGISFDAIAGSHIVLTRKTAPVPEGYMFRSSKTYIGWTDLSETNNGNSAISLILCGEELKDNAAAISLPESVTAKAGDPTEVTVEVRNLGLATLNSVGYSYEYAGQSGEGTIELPTAVSGDFYGAPTTASIELPAVNEKGEYKLTLTTTMANGKANEATAVAESNVKLLLILPKHRTLVEEYTGTWCGWCPRGYVAMEMIAEQMDDDAIGVSYHTNDPMQCIPESAYPTDFGGMYPTSVIDRAMIVDPYYGSTGVKPFGIASDIAARNKVLAPADVNVKAEWNEDQTIINVSADATFLEGDPEAKYELGYMLVADGLTGEGSGWTQANYFVTDPDLYVGDPNLERFVNGEENVDGLVFNDVVVSCADYYGYGVWGSLPSVIEEGKTYEHNYQFYLDWVRNTSGETVIQDMNKLRVVVVLIDGNTHEVLNANKTKVTDGINKIDSAALNNGVSTVVYTDLSGRRVISPKKGVFIKTTTNANGQTSTSKVVFK